MAINFKKILLPVDFTKNTEVAVKRTLELIDPEGSVIYLYHVISHGWWQSLTMGLLFFKSDKLIFQSRQARRKAFQLKYTISKLSPRIAVKIEIVVARNINKNIIRKAHSIKPDLIIIGRGQEYSVFPWQNTVSSARIAAKSNAAVLSIKPENLHDTLRSIVMPVGKFVPGRKIELILALSKKFRVRVDLIAITGNSDRFSAKAFVTTYRLLKQGLQCPVEVHLLHTLNTAKTVLHYTEQIKADILLANEETETNFTSFSDRQIDDVVSVNSHLQVLSVKP